MATVLKTKFQLRRGNAEVWARNNPVLERGEPGFEIDTGRLKIGNGQTAWNDLEYLAPQSGAGGGVQFDWNQNDNTQPDYVKNRPFYTGDPVETVLVEESTVSFAENHGMHMAQFPSTFAPTVGETYKVSWDGTVYECTCVSFQGMSAIGNLSIAGAGSDTGEPFVVAIADGRGIQIGTTDTSASHTFSISVLAQEIVKIDTKYIPVQVKNIPNGPDAWTDEQKAQYLSDFQNGTVLILGDTTAASVITYVQYSKNLGLQVTYIEGNNIKSYNSSSGYTRYDMDLIEDRATNGYYTATNAQTMCDVIKYTITEIPDYAFKSNTELESIDLPNLTSIGEYAFSGCSKLALTSLPSGITSIGTSAFVSCANLALTSLPSGITSIGANAFQGCEKLALTSLPSGITSIGNYAFFQCTNLVLTSLPSSITRIGTSTFANCTNLALTSLPSGLTIIDNYAFVRCTKLALTSLPSGITSIGVNAFFQCTGLTSITFTGTPTSISSAAFKECTNLTTINVPWAEGAVADAPWGATNATINYNYTGA